MGEYKIGEIFQYGNTWLQCVKGKGCSNCYFYHNQREIGSLLTCSALARSDKEGAIFKELPKELPIGFEFIHQARKLRVEEEYDGCSGCAFEGTSQCGYPFDYVFECSIRKRKGGKPIIFRDITDENKENKHKTVKFKYMKPERKKLTIPEGWEFDRLENGEIILKTKKPTLPTTWEECLCVVDEAECIANDAEITPFKVSRIQDKEPITDADFNSLPKGMGKPMLALCQLLICRNAWWKILNWKPNWENNECMHSIDCYRGKMLKSTSTGTNHILAFPTEETRDKFLETFKDLIEEAKELL